MQIRAQQRNPELRDAWIRGLANYDANQLIFVDESAANEHTGDRKYGWAPIGVRPIENRSFRRSERWSILPAYTVDGFITWEVVHGSFSAQKFEEFIENELLPLCSPYPHPQSVICMDNAPIHQLEVPSIVLHLIDDSA
jgi:DDE superfamily endonuclease